MKVARIIPIFFALPLPVTAAEDTTTGLWLFFLLYAVGFVFAILLLVVIAQKGQGRKDK